MDGEEDEMDPWGDFLRRILLPASIAGVTAISGPPPVAPGGPQSTISDPDEPERPPAQPGEPD